jgi:TRAP transporter TAXI family solute receptor
MRLGTGPDGGSFGPIGNTLCETLNEVRKTSLVRCIALRSAGSVFNIFAVANDSLQLGLGQEDLIAEAFLDGKGTGGDNLRAVALMHSTPIGIMVRKGSGITDLSQIVRAVVNRGVKGSGMYANSIAILNAMNLKESDLASVTFMPPTDVEKAFCEGRVDVFINAIAHPSDTYRRLRACGGEFIDIPSDVMKKMMQGSAYLRPMKIAAGMYDDQQKQVNTIGARNLLITNSTADEEAIFRVASLINSKYKYMLSKQPHMSSMVLMRPGDAASLPVPMHPGALRALQSSKP